MLVTLTAKNKKEEASQASTFKRGVTWTYIQLVYFYRQSQGCLVT